MISRRQLLLYSAATAFASSPDPVRLVRVPRNGMQPQAVIDSRGSLHLLFLTGEPGRADVFYTRSSGGDSFAEPLRVNNEPGSAIAAGTIRGGQIALGRKGRVHVAWNGSAKPAAPMLYSRMNDGGDAFEPQRNLMRRTAALDGGGTLTADRSGNVYVAWHGIAESDQQGEAGGEARRRVWVARSEDDGRTFGPETAAWAQATGCCACCGMKLFAAAAGAIYGLYRSATEQVHRDVYLLASQDSGRSFTGTLLDRWQINACPMSSMDIAEGQGRVVAAWETAGQIRWARIDGKPGVIASAPGEGKGRKHPRIAVNPAGEVLLVWTEGTGWKRGGDLAWQIYDAAGHPLGPTRREAGAIPAWSFAAAVARPDGGFTILA